jgi:hypothetical protein
MQFEKSNCYTVAVYQIIDQEGVFKLFLGRVFDYAFLLSAVGLLWAIVYW